MNFKDIIGLFLFTFGARMMARGMKMIQSKQMQSAIMKMIQNKMSNEEKPGENVSDNQG